MSAIESLKHRALSFAGANAKLKNAAEAVFDELIKTNKNNIEALLPIRAVEFGKVELRWNELNYEDIEVECTYSYDDPITGERVEGITATERNHRRDLADEARDAQAGPALKRAYQELGDALEDAVKDCPELMWNFSWRPYGDDVNLELANSIPQLMGVTYKGDKYFTLSSCGQDNGPAIMAYIAIEHGVIDPDHVHYLTRDGDLEWTMYVIGRSWLMRVAKALGVEKQIKAKLNAIAARKAAAAKKAEALRQKREAVRLTPLSPTLRQALISAFMLNPYARWDSTPSLYADEETLKEVTTKADAWDDVSKFIFTALGLTNEQAAARAAQRDACADANSSPLDYVVNTVVGGVLPVDAPLPCRACGDMVGTTVKSVGTTLFRICEGCGETYEVTKKA